MNNHYYMTVYQEGIYSSPILSPFEPSLFQKVQTSYHIGKILRANHVKKHLVFNSIDGVIQVLQIKPDGAPGVMLDIPILEDGAIADLIVMKQNRIICITSKGYVAVYDYEISSYKLSQRSILAQKLELKDTIEEEPLTLCSVDDRNAFLVHTFYKKDGHRRAAYSIKFFYVDYELGILMKKSEIFIEENLLHKSVSNTSRGSTRKSFRSEEDEEEIVLSNFEAVACKVLKGGKEAILMACSYQADPIAVFCLLDLKNWDIFEYTDERMRLENMSFIKSISVVGDSFMFSDDCGNIGTIEM